MSLVGRVELWYRLRNKGVFVYTSPQIHGHLTVDNV